MQASSNCFFYSLDGSYIWVSDGSVSKVAASQVYKVIYKHLQDCTCVKELDNVQTKGKPQKHAVEMQPSHQEVSHGDLYKTRNPYLAVKSK